MLPDRVSNPGPLTYKSGALPIVLRGPARDISSLRLTWTLRYQELTVALYQKFHVLILASGKKLNSAYKMANIADPDQTAPQEQSDQGLHCLLRCLGPNV